MNILLAIVATYGITVLIAEYDGLFGIFYKLREKDVTQLTHCVVCLSVWIALPISMIAQIGLLGYLAVVGLIVMIERFA